MKLADRIAAPQGIEAEMNPFAIAICSVTISDGACIDQHLADQCTLYAVHIQNALTGRSWVVYRRYSDFVLFREKMAAHFQNSIEIVPKAFNSIMMLRFPKKKPFPRKSTLHHREIGFLQFLRNVHDILLDQEYYLHRDISCVGFAILKSFLGSRLHPHYANAYFINKTIPQHKLPLQQRLCVIQCGSLETVLEEPDLTTRKKRIKSEAVIEMSMTASLASDDDHEYNNVPSSTKSHHSQSKPHHGINIKRLRPSHWFSTTIR
ncbi:hypothetical protein THRCLA_05139 [Thraustotheca clavata]|uniref:PX domain-containing protein n=1 Tax=Thraustotheca clavata TaxID=74557 RepID=A0A1V9ZXG8_9STRA|nr:hypothetical protein THRCLA_05139 [Thraustotheca clavata]